MLSREITGAVFQNILRKSSSGRYARNCGRSFNVTSIVRTLNFALQHATQGSRAAGVDSPVAVIKIEAWSEKISRRGEERFDFVDRKSSRNDN